MVCHHCLDEASCVNLYRYNIIINTDLAEKKSLKDGNIVWVENNISREQEGRLKTIEDQYPQTVAIAACGGYLIGRLSVTKYKGINFDDLTTIDLAHVDPVSGNLEVSVK